MSYGTSYRTSIQKLWRRKAQGSAGLHTASLRLVGTCARHAPTLLPYVDVSGARRVRIPVHARKRRFRYLTCELTILCLDLQDDAKVRLRSADM
jgi:hypothetical protein